MDNLTKIAVTIQIEHSYFSDDLVQGLKISPTATGLSELSRFHGQLFTNGANFGVAVRAKNTDSGVEPQIPIPSGSSVPLALEATNPLFFNYTDISFSHGFLLYANNLNPEGDVCAFESLPLQEDRFSIPLSGEPARVLSVEIRKLDQTLVQKQELTTMAARSSVGIDMTTNPEGGYEATVTTSDQVHTYRFFKSKSLTWSQPLGVFEWFTPGPKVPQADGYTLRFTSRETYWQYYLVQKNWLELDEPNIEPITVEDKHIEFIRDPQSLLPNGQEAVLFTSTQPLPFKQIPNWMFRVKTKGEKKGIPLPYASPKQLGVGKIPGVDHEVHYSNIYVYL